jgi:predicted Ser/Thr protein kinase
MSHPPLNKIERLFHKAVELSPAERSAFLDAHCVGDPALRSAVEDLLAQDSAGRTLDRLLESPIVREETTVVRSSASDTVGNGATVAPTFPGENAISGFQLIEYLGHGGMGVVYKARQLGLDRLVALKMLRADAVTSPEQLDRFRAEAAALARLQHPNVVQIYEVGEWQGRPYFAMEYVPGRSLAERLDGSPRPPGRAAQLIEVLARAVHAVHLRGIIHRDLKPANILFVRDSVIGEAEANLTDPNSGDAEPFRVKITDFGIAKDVSSSRNVTRTGQAMGTPAYMAPEQAMGKADQIGPATDIYALGAILYELLTGRAPFAAATSAEVFSRLLSEDPLPPARLVPDLPRDLETICLKCLQRDPKKRYRSAAALADDLERYRTGRPIEARRIGPVERIWHWCRRQPLTAASLAAAILLLIALVSTVLIYDMRLRHALAQAEQTAEDERRGLVRLEIDIGTRELTRDDPLAALLWFADAFRLDQKEAANEAEHRDRITQGLRQAPELLELGAYEEPIVQTRVGAGGCLTVTAHPSGSVRFWKVATGEPAASDLRHGSVVEVAEFDADGSHLATACAAGRICVWDIAAEREVGPRISMGKRIKRLAFAAPSKLLVQCADQTVEVVDVPSGKRWSPFPGPVRYSLLSEDGSSVLVVDEAEKTRLLQTGGGNSVELPVALDRAKGQSAVALNRRRCGLTDTKNVVHIWDIAKRAWLSEIRPVSRVSCLCLSPDGDRLLVASEDGTAQVWTTGVPQPIAFPHQGSSIAHAVFSGDGRRVLTVTRENRARVWDSGTGRALTPILSENCRLSHGYFGPDGDTLVLVDEPGLVRTWGIARETRRLERLRDEPAEVLALLAQVSLGRRLDGNGVVSPLAAADVGTAWAKLRVRLATMRTQR